MNIQTSNNAGHWNTINQLNNSLPPLPQTNQLRHPLNTHLLGQSNDSSSNTTRVNDLLNQLRLITSPLTNSPVAILQASLERIQSLTQRCSHLEQEHAKVIQAFQKLVAVEQEAERNRTMITSSISTAVSSTATSPIIEPLKEMRNSTPHSMMGSSTHLSALATQSALSRRSSADDALSDLSADASLCGSMSPPASRSSSTRSAVPTAASTPALATISSNGSIIGCSQSFAELFGFSYLFSRSIAGVYNLFTLIPDSATQIRSAIEQALEAPPSQAIIQVQWWLKNCQVLMVLSPMSNPPADLPSNDSSTTCFSASFRVIQMTPSTPVESQRSVRQDHASNTMFRVP